ncbi:hypothetical protein HQ535_08985 [bacterium]|nr:hypothetical protein [bacterium]
MGRTITVMGTLDGRVGHDDPTPADIVAHLLERPGDAWEVSQALAGKVAGPWVEYDDNWKSTIRHEIGTAKLELTRVSRAPGQGTWHFGVGDDSGHIDDGSESSAERARHSADAALTAAGWVLADTETSDHGRGDHADE